MRYKAIVAVDKNFLIGNGSKIPWHISEDFKHFKRTTMGGVIVFGKNTWQSIGMKALAGRENAILSSTLTGTPEENVKYFKSKQELVEHYKNDTRQVWICGGSKIYDSFLPDCDEIIMSKIKGTFKGDTYFPDITHMFKESDTIFESEQFDIVRYLRIDK